MTIIVALFVAIAIALVITAMHLSHKNDISFIKSEAKQAIEKVSTMSYRQGWMHGSFDERQLQLKAVNDVIYSVTV